jgi:hypothetical protein
VVPAVTGFRALLPEMVVMGAAVVMAVRVMVVAMGAALPHIVT